ncbi:MAG: AAA family ATPase [Candidatus Micrarchaeaceae archaeon]
MDNLKVIIITGVPGTGKTTLSISLSKHLKNSILINTNEFSKTKKLYIKKDIKDGAFIIDLKKLRKALILEIKKAKLIKKNYIIIEGHILSDIKLPHSKVIVLRSHLKNLETRLKKRNYSKYKLGENIISEALDYCGYNAKLNYVNVYELIGTKENLIKKSIDIINDKKVKKIEYDLLQEFKNKKYQKYLI